MKSIIDQSPGKRVSLIRDDSDESGKYYTHTEYFDDAHLHHNKRLRLEGLMPKDRTIPFGDGGVGCQVRYAFRIPPDQFALFMRQFPELHEALVNGDEMQRMRAAEKLARLKPQWCITEANR